MTMVKICGLTNLDDARWAWQCGADLLGFILVPSSKRYINQEMAAEIVHALGEEGCTARYVGVFANPRLDQVDEVVARCGFHYAQLHGLEGSESLDDLRVPAITAHRVKDSIDWVAITPQAAYAYLLDTYKPGELGGTGNAWHWRLAHAGRPADTRIILAGGLTPDNVRQAMRQVQPWGVDVASGTESCPGQKNPDKVAQFIRNVREEDGS